MDNGHELRTERLRLRRWREADRAAFAQMNADPEVMEHFPAPLTRRDSDLLVDRIEAGFDQHGFTYAALPMIVSFTAAINARSRAVMHRLGMTHDPADDFDHPNVPPGHRLRRHVLYRISPAWQQTALSRATHSFPR